MIDRAFSNAFVRLDGVKGLQRRDAEDAESRKACGYAAL